MGFVQLIRFLREHGLDVLIFGFIERFLAALSEKLSALQRKAEYLKERAKAKRTAKRGNNP